MKKILPLLVMSCVSASAFAGTPVDAKKVIDELSRCSKEAREFGTSDLKCGQTGLNRTDREGLDSYCQEAGEGIKKLVGIVTTGKQSQKEFEQSFVAGLAEEDDSLDENEDGKPQPQSAADHYKAYGDKKKSPRLLTIYPALDQWLQKVESKNCAIDPSVAEQLETIQMMIDHYPNLRNQKDFNKMINHRSGGSKFTEKLKRINEAFAKGRITGFVNDLVVKRNTDPKQLEEKVNEFIEVSMGEWQDKFRNANAVEKASLIGLLVNQVKAHAEYFTPGAALNQILQDPKNYTRSLILHRYTSALLNDKEVKDFLKESSLKDLKKNPAEKKNAWVKQLFYPKSGLFSRKLVGQGFVAGDFNKAVALASKHAEEVDRRAVNDQLSGLLQDPGFQPQPAPQNIQQRKLRCDAAGGAVKSLIETVFPDKGTGEKKGFWTRAADKFRSDAEVITQRLDPLAKTLQTHLAILESDEVCRAQPFYKKLVENQGADWSIGPNLFTLREFMKQNKDKMDKRAKKQGNTINATYLGGTLFKRVNGFVEGKPLSPKQVCQAAKSEFDSDAQFIMDFSKNPGIGRTRRLQANMGDWNRHLEIIQGSECEMDRASALTVERVKSFVEKYATSKKDRVEKYPEIEGAYERPGATDHKSIKDRLALLSDRFHQNNFERILKTAKDFANVVPGAHESPKDVKTEVDKLFKRELTEWTDELKKADQKKDSARKYTAMQVLMQELKNNEGVLSKENRDDTYQDHVDLMKYNYLTRVVLPALQAGGAREFYSSVNVKKLGQKKLGIIGKEYNWVSHAIQQEENSPVELLNRVEENVKKINQGLAARHAVTAVRGSDYDRAAAATSGEVAGTSPGRDAKAPSPSRRAGSAPREESADESAEAEADAEQADSSSRASSSPRSSHRSSRDASASSRGEGESPSPGRRRAQAEAEANAARAAEAAELAQRMNRRRSVSAENAAAKVPAPTKEPAAAEAARVPTAPKLTASKAAAKPSAAVATPAAAAETAAAVPQSPRLSPPAIPPRPKKGASPAGTAVPDASPMGTPAAGAAPQAPPMAPPMGGGKPAAADQKAASPAPAPAAKPAAAPSADLLASIQAGKKLRKTQLPNVGAAANTQAALMASLKGKGLAGLKKPAAAASGDAKKPTGSSAIVIDINRYDAAGLKTLKAADLTVDQLKGLSPTKLGQLDPNELKKLTQEQLKGLSMEQVTAVEAAKRRAVTEDEWEE